MTLASVRDKLLEFDKTSRITGREHPSIRILDVVRMLEDDPQFKLPEQALYRVHGPVNLARLTQLLDLVNRPSLLVIWNAADDGLVWLASSALPRVILTGAELSRW